MVALVTGLSQSEGEERKGEEKGEGDVHAGHCF